MRVQNTKRTVTRSGTGAVKVKFKAAKKLRKTQKLVVNVTSGKATEQFTVRVGKATPRARSSWLGGEVRRRRPREACGGQRARRAR